MKARFLKHIMLVLLTGVLQAGAQLAITEVMSGASISDPSFKGPDFWELTNFGTNMVHLDGYGFNDNDTNTIQWPDWSDLVIHPGESIVFVRSNYDNPFTPAQFRSWWGEANLSNNLQIHVYEAPGLDAESGDALWLRDPSDSVVAAVEFGEATVGQSFVYNPETGEFGRVSVVGEGCGFNAAGSDDVGSPGCTTGGIGLSIIEQPASQRLAGCGRASLRVRAKGMPRPKYQWFADGAAIEGGTDAILDLPEVQTSGEYHVVLNNGLEETVSATAVLTIDTNPLAPIVVRAPEGVILFRDQTAFFSVEARGFPCVTYQWQTNGVDLPGETGSSVRIDMPWDAPYGSQQCCVRISNDVGFTNLCANLTVTHRPHLKITEVMTQPMNDLHSPHKDWFELTNADTNEVDLKGYRFRAFRAATSIGIASAIPDHLVIQPGESVIFVEHMTPAGFVQWWGAENLSPGLQIVTWHGWAVDDEEILYLWNPSAIHSKTEDGRNEVSSASFADTLAGVSQELTNYCDDYGCPAQLLGDSAPGVNGAFHAAELGDIGSPGFYQNPVLLQIAREGAEVTLKARVLENRTYQLSHKGSLSEPSWTPLSTHTSAAAVLIMQDGTTGNAATRFYRLEELP